MVSFIPDKIDTQKVDQVPFYEDSQEARVRGYATTKSITALQKEITQLLARLNAFGVTFVPGKYPAGKHQRHGFQINFVMGTTRGRIDCAALPIRSETAHKKDRAQAQALFLVRNELEAALMAVMYKPGSAPLVPYMLNDKGQTYTEWLAESGAMPSLPAPNGMRG
jgi:hypothetical protein